MQAVQNAVRSYIRNEWIYWVVAVVATLALLMLSAPGAEAKPVLMKTVDTVKFYQDTQQGTWFMEYHGDVTDMNENYDSIKVVWHGTYSNTPLVLIAGNEQGCSMDYQLFWFLNNGDVRQAKGFGTCDARVKNVTIEDGYVVIQFDTFRKRVPLQ